jgi:hypothetical protein
VNWIVFVCLELLVCFCANEALIWMSYGGVQGSRLRLTSSSLSGHDASLESPPYIIQLAIPWESILVTSSPFPMANNSIVITDRTAFLGQILIC